jgi:carbonic anhydrase
MVTAQEALLQLQEGNRRFVSNIGSHEMLLNHARLDGLPLKQEPFAIVLGCSDARVPAEIVFDQGVGDLFVIRIAGNIVAPSIVGSIEFAASRFNTRLVVVLGHSQCGAIEATLEELQKPSEKQSHNLLSIVNRIRPSVEGLLSTDLRFDLEALKQHAIRANVGVSVSHLNNDSEILKQLILNEGLLVVGAEYSLETGLVNFLDIK